MFTIAWRWGFCNGMELNAYLTRIGFDGAPRVDIDTLRAVHRGHVTTIPYENLDVQFGRPVTRNANDAFAKIVGDRRGGWCFEMNALLGWALETIGFSVIRLAAGVGRMTDGDGMIGNHLVLLVRIPDDPRAYLCDAGFGDALIEPAPLRAHGFRAGPLPAHLKQVEDGWWRCENFPPGGGHGNFDFHTDYTGAAKLDHHSDRLQNDPQSSFVLNAVAQIWRGETHHCLRGRILTSISAAGKRQTLIETADQYVDTLGALFTLDLPAAATLWPRITARHEAIFAASSSA